MVNPDLDAQGQRPRSPQLATPVEVGDDGAMTTPSDVTLVRDAIHNPNEPRHFMQAVGSFTAQATVGEAVVAKSDNAVKVTEVGRSIYDPVIYFPRSDVDMEALGSIDKTTHCPLKGDTEYFDVVTADGRLAEAAWSYTETIPEAAVLKDLVAFDASHVTIT